ncbi:MAG: cutinase family protein [Mycobacterium sp.]
MTGVTLLPKSARLAATVSAVVGAAVTCLSAAPAASADPCSDVKVVFARGTNDAPGLGRAGQAFADSLEGLLAGRTVTTYAVNYPASYDFLTAQDGAADAATYITSLVTQCPSTRIVLGGYSQGAAVVDMLAGVPPLGNKIGDIGSAPPLASALVPKVAAVVAFGNPATKFGNPVTSSVFGGRAIDLCKDGDPICSRGRNPFAHSDYVTAGLTDQAANFVAGIV